MNLKERKWEYMGAFGRKKKKEKWHIIISKNKKLFLKKECNYDCGREKERDDKE